MIYDYAHSPRSQYLKGKNAKGSFKAAKFPMNGRYGRSTRNI